MAKEEIEQAQTLYCEKYGILESTVKGAMMTYYTSHLQSRVTYKVTVDLEQGRQIERKEMKNYLKKGEVNMYL